MTNIFLDLVNLSISAGWFVLVILLIRFIFPEAPRWVFCLLWGMVGLRLICPVPIESLFSLIPNPQTIPDAILSDPTPAIDIGIPAINSAVNPVISQAFAPEPTASANPLQFWIPVAAVLWLAGMAVMLLYTAFTYCRLRLQLRTAVRLHSNIYQSETVTSPFVLGLIRPRIYLPFSIEETNLPHVLSHEQAHIRRGDHWWKPLGFCILSVYWFNPVLWLAYILLCRDIEAACDEKVVATMSTDARRAYSEALLSCALRRKSIAACPLAFGETGVKGRIQKVMRYKRPAFWVLVISAVLCIAAAVCFLTVPISFGVRSVALMANGTDEAILQIRYTDLHSYSVELPEETDGEYVSDGIVPYDGSLGKYRILIRLGDARMGKDYSKAFLEKYPVEQVHELPGAQEALGTPLRMKLACPDDTKLLLYIGADVPLSVQETQTILLEDLRGNISITIRLQELPEVPETEPVPTESSPASPYKLTFEDVIRLSKKGADLKVQDFLEYDCITINPYNSERRIYRIDDTFYVLILPDGVNGSTEPYIRLYAHGASISLLTDDVEAFIRAYSTAEPEQAVQTSPFFPEDTLARVTAFTLWNGVTQEETTITDPADVQMICRFLMNLSGTNPDIQPLTEGIYTLQFIEGSEKADFLGFGAGNRFYHRPSGGYGYTRYLMESIDIDTVASFLSSFEEEPYDWFSAGDAAATAKTMTEQDVIFLSQKGYGLTWKDLTPYQGYPIESGYEYPIRDGCVLRVIDNDTRGIPKGVYYVPTPIGTCFEIRNANIEGYMESHTPEIWHQRITDAITDHYDPDPTLIHAISYIHFLDGTVVETPPYYTTGLYHGIQWEEVVYLLVMYKTYRIENGTLLEVSRHFEPAVLSYRASDSQNSETYLLDYHIPDISDSNLSRVLTQFPTSDNTLTPEEYAVMLEAECDRKASQFTLP